MALRSSSRTAAWIRAALLVLLAIPPVGFSAFLVDGALEEIRISRDTHTWPSTPGYVTVSEYAPPKGGGRSVAVVRYRYVVDGVPFEGRRPQYGNFAHGSDITRQFGVGPARVYYSPANPGEAVLRTGLAPATHEVLALMVAMGAVPGAFLLWKAVAEVKYATLRKR